MRWTSAKRSPLILSLALLAGLLLAPPAAAGPTQGSQPGQFRALIRADGTAERALFHAEKSFERCIWSTDGTPEGTFRLDIDGQCLPVREHLSPIVGAAEGVGYLLVGRIPLRVWRSDGTATGTWPLIDFIDPGWWAFDGAFELLHSPALDLVFFLADDGVHGVEPWVSDGTPGGARLLAEVVPEGEEGHAFHLQEVAGQVLFFRPREGEHELWRSDGTSGGTRPVTPIADGDPATAPSRLFPVAGGAVFFLTPEHGCTSELWRTDGTAAGTGPLGRFDMHPCIGPGPNEAFSVAAFPGSVFFAASRSGGGGDVLWRTDGMPDGTWAVTEPQRPIFFDADTLAENAVSFGGELYFVAWEPDGVGREIWRTDGTPGSGEPFADLCPGACSSDPRHLQAAGDDLVFFAHDGERGVEPWISDGTPAGTRPVADLCAGSCSSGHVDDRGLVLGEALLFAGSHGIQGQDLWSLDPAAESFVRLTTAHPVGVERAAVIRGLALFAADDGEHGGEPWITDGTPGGTRMLVDVEPAEDLVVIPPLDLTAEPLGGGRVRLHWRDAGGDEESFGFDVVRADSGEIVLTATAPANATSLVIELEEGTYTVRGFAFHPEIGRTEWSDEVVVQVGACAPGGRFLCLGGGRFRVSVDWSVSGLFPGNPDQGAGIPAATTISGNDSGSFWFFTEDNVELIVKILDATTVNGHFWVFWGGLSSVEYRLYVEDTLGGLSRTYFKPQGDICGGTDTTAFPAGESTGTASTVVAVRADRSSWARELSDRSAPFAASGPATRFVALDAPATTTAPLHPPQPCVPDGETLCLLDGMLAVTVDWTDQHNGGSGVGRAVPYTDVSGFFWFFHPENIELVVKALDGRTVNGKIWVFYGALSDVGYTIRVENRADGHLVRTYTNPPGVICGNGDTAAF